MKNRHSEVYFTRLLIYAPGIQRSKFELEARNHSLLKCILPSPKDTVCKHYTSSSQRQKHLANTESTKAFHIW